MKEIYKDLKVLFVEDDDETRESLFSILKRYFVKIDIATNGEDGLLKAKENFYDIIITDIVMPKLDGIKMIKKIQTNNKISKFIILTAYSNKEFLIQAIEMGINGYLLKPITFKQIANTLKKVTTEIYNEKQLKQNIDEIQKLSQIKSEFLANMSHEIRTPLNAILGFIKVMKDEDDGKFSKYLNIIDSSSQTLLTIINDILDISKIEAGKMNIEYINFHSDEIYNTLELFEEKAHEKNIDYKIKFINIPEFLYSDVHRLKQIISNLISNAIKFTPENKKVEIKIEYANKKLFVEVKDEGIGIPKDRIETIFNAFSQADNSTTRKYGGTGLGLTISHKLVEMLGGELKVESQLEKGSRFYFEIPMKIGIDTGNRIENDNNKINSNIKILVAEDNTANQMFMKVILKKLNLDFDIANHGKEAVELVKKNKYDLVLMDINMPIMSGVEATLEIRKFSNIPIIALTASALDGDKERFIEAGMNDYLSKPLNIHKLKQILEKY